jgi:GT2 family glycosyltransferase
MGALVPQLPPHTEVLLVDNHSTDGTSAWCRATYPDVRLIELPANCGFAGGVAEGLAHARGQLVLLLNNDAFVEPGCIAALRNALTARPDIGAVGGVLTFDHRPDLVASAGIRFRRDGVALDLWPGKPVADLRSEPIEILGPTGALALYRHALLRDVGPPDPGFFNYLEDVDLAWRAQLRGWRSLTVPAARARHVYSATGVQGSPLKQRLLGRNRVRVIARCLPGPLLVRHFPAILAYDLLATGYGLATERPAIVAGRLDALHTLPDLLRQRRTIQARRTAPISALARWLEPTVPPWVTLREQRRLEAILNTRPA